MNNKRGLGRGLGSLFGEYDQYDIEDKKVDKETNNSKDLKNSTLEKCNRFFLNFFHILNLYIVTCLILILSIYEVFFK